MYQANIIQLPTVFCFVFVLIFFFAVAFKYRARLKVSTHTMYFHLYELLPLLIITALFKSAVRRIKMKK